MGAKFYGSLAEYEGAAFLKAWDEKTEGEVGPLVKYPPTAPLVTHRGCVTRREKK